MAANPSLIHGHARLAVPPLLACAADVACTLLGQSTDYWAGDRSAVSEFNPAARLLLLVHPMLFVAAAVVTSTIVVALVLGCNRSLAGSLSLLVTLGHTIAAGAWLAKSGPIGWVGGVVLLLVVRWAYRSTATTTDPNTPPGVAPL